MQGTASTHKGPDTLAQAERFPHGLGLSAEQLSHLNQEKDNAALEALGGVHGLCEALQTSPTGGLDPSPQESSSRATLDQRKQVFGANEFKEVPTKAFLVLLLENLKDPTLLLLMAAAMVSTVLGFVIKSQREESAWTEGIAIWVAVAVVSGVGAGNDYQKDLQFKKLNATRATYDVKVLRGRADVLVPNTGVVVGDVLILDTGDKVVADGVLLEAHGLVIDEASLTGESEPVRKNGDDVWCRSGTQVSEGSGRIVVTAVGADSEWGRTMAMVMGESGETPLQEALGRLAANIGKAGLAVGVLCFIVLMIRWLISNRGFPVDQIASGPLQFFIFAVTIVVVAVPEGLPLAVTISLAYSMRKMMKDNNFVRVLAACETMGGATAICSDKTGTLTENRMTVVAGWFAGQMHRVLPALADLPPSLQQLVLTNAAMNSKAFLVEEPGSDKVKCVGNRTECALLLMCRQWGRSYTQLRADHQAQLVELYGFSSERKMASCLMRGPHGMRLYNKGAAEIVLRKCSSYLDEQGEVVPLGDGLRQQLADHVTAMAQQGLRTLCLTYRDLQPTEEPKPDSNGAYAQPADENLTVCCIVGIKDPVRKEVPAAVATCQRAGIMVRMVTGDNLHTASHIASECGILQPGGLVLEGPDFRKLPESELQQLLPRLQVLARSSPTDKYTLVKALKKAGEVVAVTGDGTNDAPALKESDVGLAMGIAGTEVAKEAADIVILDDNFNSIVKSVLWGRCVYANLRKFLQFQLTINLAALIIAFVAAVTTGETPLNVLQLLWINLIMDALAALALATENPNPELLDEHPHGRNEPLISCTMWKHIIVQGCWQVLVLFLVIYGAPAHLKAFALPSACTAYSNVDAHDISFGVVAGGATPAYLHPAPSPGGHFEPSGARCNKGPCVDLCCTVLPGTGFCADNLAGMGGLYLPGEQPVCSYGPKDWAGQTVCRVDRVKKRVRDFCEGSGTKCPRYSEFEALDVQADEQYRRHVNWGQERYNSVVFNTFIFLQLFNQFNARKIKDELNVFTGILDSRTFLYIMAVVVGLQLVIMLTPIATFFRVTHQSGLEWLFAIGVGAVSLPLALLTKLVTRWRSRSHQGSRAVPGEEDSDPLLQSPESPQSRHYLPSVHRGLFELQPLGPSSADPIGRPRNWSRVQDEASGSGSSTAALAGMEAGKKAPRVSSSAEDAITSYPSTAALLPLSVRVKPNTSLR